MNAGETLDLRRAKVVVVAFVIGLALRVHAEPFGPPDSKELAMKNLPFAPGAPAALLELRVDRDDTKRFETEYRRIKIFSDEGRKYADVEIPYNGSESDIRDVRLRTIHPDGSIAVFDGKPNDKLLLKVGRTRVLAKTLTAPQVTAGSIVEYSYTKRWSLEGFTQTQWVVQQELPVVRERYSFKPLRSILSCYYTYTGLPANTKPEYVNDHFELALENLPAFEEEPMSMPKEVVAPHVKFYYMYGDLTKVNDYFGNSAAKVSTNYETFIGESRVIAEEAQKLVAGAATPDEKLRRIRTRLLQVHNASYPASAAERTADEKRRVKITSVEDVLRNNLGTSRNINAVFIALARAAGFDAEPVFISNRKRDVSRQMPLFSQFEHMAVTLTVDGVRRFYDVGDPALPFGMLDTDYSGVEALTAPKKGAPTWVQTPLVPAAQSRVRRSASLGLEGENLTGTLTVELTGEEAALVRQRLWEDDEAATKKHFEDDVKETLPAGSSVTLTSVNGFREPDAPLVAAFDVTLTGLVSAAGSRTLLPLSLLTTRDTNPFTAPSRKNIIVFENPSTAEDVIVIAVPPGLVIDTLPAGAEAKTGPVSYTTSVSSEANVIRFNRTLVHDLAFVPVRAYDAYRTFRADVLAKDRAAAATLKGR